MEGPELRPLPEPEPDLELDVDEPSELDPQTVLAAVRAQWEQPAEEHTFDLELPGSRGMFVLRCGPIRGAVLGKLRQRLEKSRSPEKDTNLNADVLIAACRGMYGRPSPTGELVLLEDEEGPLLRLDERLAQAMGMSGMTTARSIVLALFRHANVPDLAIAKAAGSYMEWASEAADDVSEELLGGILSWQDVKAAALIAACGLPAWRYLTTSDDETRVLLAAVAQRTVEVRTMLDRQLAQMVIYELAKATRRGG